MRFRSAILKDHADAVKNGYNLPDGAVETGRTRVLSQLRKTKLGSAEHGQSLSAMVFMSLVENKLKKYGVDSGEILKLAETTTGETMNLMTEGGRKDFISATNHLLGEKHGAEVATQFEALLSLDPATGASTAHAGFTGPQDVYRQSTLTMLGKDPADPKTHTHVYFSDAGDAEKPTYILKIDTATGKVERIQGKLVKGKDGRLEQVFDMSGHPDYADPKNRLTMQEWAHKTNELAAKVMHGWENWVKAKLKDAKLPPKVAETATQILDRLWVDPKTAHTLTADLIGQVWGLNKAESAAAAMFLKTLGLTDGDTILKIAKDHAGLQDGVFANIIVEGNRALIRAGKSADLSSFIHESGHFHRITFCGETEAHQIMRAKAGISEEMWSNFKKDRKSTRLNSSHT